VVCLIIKQWDGFHTDCNNVTLYTPGLAWHIIGRPLLYLISSYFESLVISECG